MLSGAGRYAGEKRHCVGSYQFQWLKEKHLVGLGSKEHKPSKGDYMSWEQTAFKTNATSFVGFRHNLLEVLFSFRAVSCTMISTCRGHLLPYNGAGHEKSRRKALLQRTMIYLSCECYSLTLCIVWL